MSSEGSVTHWIGQLKAGNDEGAQHLWDRYFQRLVGYARKKMQNSDRRHSNEEDVAISAFKSLCLRAKHDGFKKLDDRDDLWQLLVVLTARKVIDHKKHDARLKRGGHLRRLEGAAADEEMHQVIGDEPSPEFAVQVAEERGRLLELLDDDLRRVAEMRMEGHTNEEIAHTMGCVVRTVERRLRVIRSVWSGAV